MPSNHHTDEVFVQKKRPKRPIKFNVQLNEEQKQAKAKIIASPITVIKGMAGSGKTLVATQVALDMLFTRQVDKVIITRPTVSKEDIGFLPGDIREKMDPWLAPIYHNLNMLYNKEKVQKLLDDETIEIVPFAFLRGRTFVDSFVIVDEAQNVTHSQMETVIGRLGKGSKMVICGDMAQIDLKDKRETGFSFLSRVEENVEGFKTASLEYNHRHEIVAPVLKVYKTFRD
jgi:phosphate starvation-inducible protein PhoH and related proteins|tara:strand:+ start:2966 stop:3652 length:687 start_codon:yes stop_codon:yes gene_type:complete